MSLPPKITITPEDVASVTPAGPAKPVSPARPAGPGNPGEKLVIMLESDGDRRKKSGSLWVVLVAGVIGVAAGIVAAAYWPRGDWMRAIDRAADRGVVLIQVDAEGEDRDGVGTGFVAATEEGRALIVTNKHVLWNDKEKTDAPPDAEVTVVCRSGAALPAKVVGWHRSEDVDLAVLLVETDCLKPMGRIAPFRQVRLGEEVVAVGHPSGVLTFSFSRGTVERKWNGRFIQSSTPLNPGNSGGPLLDEQGRIIGVNTAIVVPDAGESKAISTRADLLLVPQGWECVPEAKRLLSQVE